MVGLVQKASVVKYNLGKPEKREFLFLSEFSLFVSNSTSKQARSTVANHRIHIVVIWI